MYDPGFRQQFVAQETRRLDRVARQAPRTTRSPATQDVTIRISGAHDGKALDRLSAFESRPLPAGKFLVAEIAGEVVAALPVAGGEPFGNPFRPNAQLVQLMRLRLRQVAPGRRVRRVPAAAWSLARG